MDTKAKFGDCDAKMDLSTSDNTEYESDELFSDDEQKKEIQCRSETSQDVTVSRLFETPSMLLSSNSSCPVTHDATVPSTPLSLLPFLNKVNEQWTSDLETPQAQPHVASSTGTTTQETPKLEQCTFQARNEISSTEIDVDEIASASPVIVSKAVRRRPKRRIFRTSLSVDPQAVTNSDDVTTNINVEIPLTSESSVCGIQHDATNVATVLPDGNDFKDCESDILNKTQDKCNSKESENPVNTSNSSTQEFFKNASFSKLERDELCSDNFDKQAVTEYTGQYNQRDAIENIDRDDNGAQENINIDFTSARGTSFKISKQAALKAKRLFADVFDTDEVQNYESLAKKSFIERRDEHSPSCSLAESPPINDTKEEVVAKPKPQFTEQADQLETETRHNRKLPSTQCDFQTARGASVKISESSFSKAKALFAEQLNDISEDTFEEKLPEERALSAEQLNDQLKNRREIKPSVIQCGFQTARGASVTISESSLSKAKALFAEQLNDISEDTFEEKLPEERALSAEQLNDQFKNSREIKSPVIQCGFQTACGASVTISESSLSKAKALFAEQLNDISEDTFEEKLPEERALSAERLNDQFKNREIKPPIIQCSFQTARGASVTISESSLSKAKALFAEQLNDISEDTFEGKLPEERALSAEQLNDQFKNSREIKPPVVQCGFQTARGASVTISESSLSKAKALFAEQLKDISVNDTSEDTFEEKLTEERALFAERLNDQFKNREIKPPIIQCGFQTARGTSVTISESSFSKAKALFAEQLNDISEDTFEGKLPEERALSAEQLNDQFKNSREIKPPVVQCGFQTARGASVTISESSLSKAKALFAEQLNDISEDTLEEKLPEERALSAERLNDQFKNREIKPPVIQCGFQTARGASVTISDSSFSKAKALFAEQLNDISENDDFEDISEQKLSEERAVFAERLNDQFKNKREIKPPIIQGGFQTARGASVKISQSALSKARAFFDDDLSDISEPIRPEEKNSDFRSTSAVSNYSVQTLLKPKISFTKRLTSPLESIVAKRNNVSGRVENRQDTKLPSVGRDIQTARRDTSVRIPRRVLYRPKFLSAHRLDFSPEASVQENAANVCGGDTTKRRDLTTSGIQQTTAAINAPLKERARSDDCPDESSPDLMRASWLQKRKSSGTSSDEYTPLGRNREFKRHESSKKARVSNELQARKLFPDDADVDTGNNENQDGNKQTSFLARSDLESPKRDTAEPSESEAASSPVIGTVFRKRRSFGHRREKKSSSQECTNEAPRENASRGKIDENRPQAGGSRNSAPERNAETGDAKSSVYGDTQLMMNFVDQSVKILRDRLAATLEQENAITAKRRHGCERSVGHLYRYKEANVGARVPLKEIGAPPVPLTYRELIERRVQPNILTVTSATAATYKFQCSDFYGSDLARSNVRGIEMEDGARLIMDENGYVGVLEFQRSFLASTGVDPNLVPARWIGNHYRWIVWKLASMDRMRFGSAVLPRSLTPSRVMAQLRYRYDREIDRSQRSALRRILEKDDVASKRMILCVSSVTENNSVSPAAAETSPRKGVAVPKWKIELTDGWYSVPACVDIGMVKYLSNGKVKEGTKLVTSGAELLNCDRGCYPLEVTADVCLRLHTNSTRRARWHAKLGYAPRSGPIPIELRNVCPNGGLIGRMTVVVARVYPMLYHERTASGDSVVRNAKCEEKAQSKYEQRCWSDIEAFYAKAEEDFQRKALPSETDDGMTIQLNEDYENLSSEDFVSEERQNELMQELRQKEERFKQQLQSKLRQSLPGPRQVSPLLKVRVCDGDTTAILSIWLPGEEIVDIVREGACVSLRNVVASGKRGSELQLTAGRCAIFKLDRRRDVSHPVRAYTPLREITSSEFAPPYGEFDTVGFVCSVGPAPYGMKDFEVAHLAYPNAPANSHDTSYLSILFWQGIASYGYTEILTVGSVVACANLEWRRASSWNIPAAYCTERSTFTRNPRRNHLHEPFDVLRDLITDPIEYVKECTSELNVELQKKATPTRYASNKNTPIKTCDSATSVDRNLADSTSAPKLGLNVTSNYVPSTSSIQKRLEKLQWYGEAPKLSPLVIRNSRRTSLQFRSPVRVSGENSTEDASRADQSGDSNTPQ